MLIENEILTRGNQRKFVVHLSTMARQYGVGHMGDKSVDQMG